MKYWAFISYSHTDKRWGDWLHKTLETYAVPRRLAGKSSRDGQIPERLFPIFRDREELPVSADLGSNINEALRDSRYLIVICSPRSAKSQWVEQEILNFKKQNGEDRVLALIVDGEPNATYGKPGFDAANECFPRAMRYRVAPDGVLSPERTEPIAADAREGKDGRENAKLKLLAGLLGIAYDELKQRDHERRLRRARFIGTASLALMGIFAGLASWAIIAARQTAAQKRETQRLFVASDTARADELFSKDDAAGALAFLARAAEQDPDSYSTAAERIWFALTQRSWSLPISAPMQHSDAILSACFSPDGTKVLTASRDSTARLWDANSGDPIGAEMKHRRLVRRALFSADGARVYTIGFDAVARLWDANTGQPVDRWRIEHPNSINSFALSSSGKWIATGSSEGTIRVSDATTAQAVAEIHQKENVHTLAFHPTDETLLLAGSGTTVVIWKLPEGREIARLRHPAQVNSAQFEPRGEWVVTSSDDGAVRIWETATGTLVGDVLKHDGAVSNAFLSSDARYLATLTGNRLLLWSLGAKPILKHTFVHDQRVACVRFTPDNLLVLSGTDGGQVQGHRVDNGESAGEPIREDGAIVAIDTSADGKRWLVATGKGETRVWQAPPRYPIAYPLVHAGAIESMSISRDGRRLATGATDDKARLWDLMQPNTPGKALVHATAVLSTKFSPDGQYLLTAAADGKARLWDTTAARETGSPFQQRTAVSKLIFDPHGKFFVTAAEDGSAQAWDTASRQPLKKLIAHGASLTALDLSSDGKVLLTAGSDGKLRLWHPENGEPTGVILQNDAEITCARFSPGGEWIAAGSRDGTVNLWSVATGKRVNQFKQKAAITDCAFSPDGQFVASASEDHTAVIREIAGERSIGASLQHTSVVSAVVFAPDSSKIATASEDGTVRLWHVSSGRAITEPLLHEKAVRLLAFSPDGQFLYSGSRDRLVKIWDVTTKLSQTDRGWLTTFALSISPFRLTEAGRLEHRSVESREVLRANLLTASKRANLFREWFFAEPSKRCLTPYANATLEDYLRALAAANRPADELKYYSTNPRP